MRASVSLVLLVLLASSLVAAEIPISQPDIVPLDTNWSAAQPDVVAGDGFLVVWSERFSRFYEGPIRFRTYDEEGVPRQALPVELGGGKSPHAFWNGSEYVIVWAPTFSRFGSVEAQPAIKATRVRPDGTIVEDSEVVLATERYGGSVVDVAWDGGRALVAVNYGNAYHLLLLDGIGNLLEDTLLDYIPSAVSLRPGGGFFVLKTENGDDAAAGGDRLAVVDAREDGVTAVILDGMENELDRFTLSDTGSFSGAIVWDGGAWVAAFNERAALCTARFTSSADVVRTCDAAANAHFPALAAGARRLFKAWGSGSQIVTDAGLASTMKSAAYYADAVVDATGLLAAWIETTADGRREIVIGGIANDGKPRPEQHVPGRQTQDSPQLARAGDQTLLVWFEGVDLRAILLDANGAPIGDGIQIRSIFGGAPVVAARGDEWVIAWRGPNGIESVRITRDLQAIDLQDFSGDAFQESSDIAATPDGYLVAWLEWNPSRLVVEPLDANGRRTTGGIRIVENDGPTANPSIGCGPDSCLVTWDGGPGEQWVKLVRHDGTPFTADRLLDTSFAPGDAVIKPQADGSFLLYRGGNVTPVSAAGEPGRTQTWHLDPLALAGVVTWRGRTTAVYARSNGQTSQIFAHEFVPRGRAVRR